MSTERRRRLLPIATVIVALVTAALVALVPFGESSSCTTVADGPTFCDRRTTSLVDTEGGMVVAVLVVPAALALVGALRPTRTVLGVVAWLLFVCCALGALSVGVFFLPTLAAAIVAAVRA